MGKKTNEQASAEVRDRKLQDSDNEARLIVNEVIRLHKERYGSVHNQNLGIPPGGARFMSLILENLNQPNNIEP